MGGCVSVSISCDQLTKNVCSCLNRNGDYIHGLEENLTALQRALEQIEQRREDLLRKILSEERRGLQRLSVVQGWVSKVEAIVPRVNELVRMRSVQVQRLCLCGFCSKNLVSSYRYGKRVMKMIEEVEVLRYQGDFAVVAERVDAARVEERPTRPMVAMDPMLESAWNRLMEDEIGILGLHGMGGVGKTTLLSHINNRFSRVGGEFDIVIWIVVSKELQIQRIQDEIWEKLRSDNEKWKQKTEDIKASNIYNVLKHKRFVLLLDDIWSKVDLTEVGVPFPSRENGCKIVFTTRLKEICGRMGVDSDMEVRCLAPDDAWDLFTKKVGEITLGSHPEIPTVARTVAKKCRGLPLALNVIGETMAYKRTVQEWRSAIDVLTSSAAEFSGMEDEILPILKYSYDNLKSEQLKLCFQYCALFPEDHNIEKNDLVDYWIGEGFIDRNKGKAENQGYEIIGILVRSCLLMEENQETVKMHDVVREMALWIASDFGKQKENFIVQAGLQSRNIPEIEKWKVARRVSLMFNNIESIRDAPESPQLITLLLRKNFLGHISSSFFRLMPMLVVLDLSMNRDLRHLPNEISECVSLQYLSLSRTRIRIWPAGLVELRKLLYLNLEYTRMVESICGISGLTSLKVLRLFVSGFPEDPCVLNELQLLENLQTLTITLGLASILEQFLSNQRLASCTRALRIENLNPQSSVISFVATMDSLQELHFADSDIWEIKVKRNETVLPLHIPTTTTFFPNLSQVSLEFCTRLRDLTWLIFAPNLTVLRVISASDLKEVINKEKAEQQNLIPFQELKELRLENVQMLKHIHRGPLPFPCLQKILVNGCSELRKLPLNFTSVPRGDLVIEAHKKWIEILEWEDEATKARFLPTLKVLSLAFICQNFFLIIHSFGSYSLFWMF
ncbi:NBS/LRR disease resistance protein [Arabidopsis thaliana]|nr:NBS/LRR disease resistance protein [Arabidopsis thaliana]